MNELIDLIDKEEVLEVEDQISKALKKENKEKTPEEIQPEKTAPVPSALPTKSDGPLNEHLLDETTPNITVKSEAEELRDSAPVLKDPLDSETVRDTTLPGVPPTKAKKTEGSKQL